ncbi:MAG: hypothetical protein PHS94_04430 [Erysipelotrichaceae bacterium]|nr:hypothetical protein [Erysipelotrichaceae bacterium]
MKKLKLWLTGVFIYILGTYAYFTLSIKIIPLFDFGSMAEQNKWELVVIMGYVAIFLPFLLWSVHKLTRFHEK